MAFQTAGEDRQESEEGSGLPKRWENLTDKCCPACSEPLIEFEHLNLWKCTCGFKIGAYKLDQIVADLERGEEFGGSRGYGFSEYQDDQPF